jgi:hypothetical protein
MGFSSNEKKRILGAVLGAVNSILRTMLLNVYGFLGVKWWWLGLLSL